MVNLAAPLVWVAEVAALLTGVPTHYLFWVGAAALVSQIRFESQFGNEAAGIAMAVSAVLLIAVLIHGGHVIFAHHAEPLKFYR